MNLFLQDLVPIVYIGGGFFKLTKVHTLTKVHETLLVKSPAFYTYAISTTVLTLMTIILFLVLIVSMHIQGMQIS